MAAPELSVERKLLQPEEGATPKVVLRFSGRAVARLLEKKQRPWHGYASSDGPELPSPLPGSGVISDSPGLPLSPSSEDRRTPATQPEAAGPRSVHAPPPGKQPQQIELIEADAQARRASAPPGDISSEGEESEGEEQQHYFAAAAKQQQNGEVAHAGPAAEASPAMQQARKRQKCRSLALLAVQAPTVQVQQEAVRRPMAIPAMQQYSAPPYSQPAPLYAAEAGLPASARTPYAALPPASAAVQPPKPKASKKRPASQPPAGAGQPSRRPAHANGQLVGGGGLGGRHPSGGSAGGYSVYGQAAGAPQQQMRPMPGAPRSLQQRHQAAAAAMGAGGGARTAAARPGPPRGGGSKAAATPRPGAAAGGVAAQQPPRGSLVWAKIGSYPWWPAVVEVPAAEHYRLKHAGTDVFVVFYGTKDYNWVPVKDVKPFSHLHPDYSRHASVKHKALQAAIDDAWALGYGKLRPDVAGRPHDGS